MSMSDRVIAAGIASILLSGAAWAGPGLGQPATPEEVAAWDISIEGGAGGENLADPLVGGIGSLASAQPVKTVGSFWPHATTLFDYIRRAMPYDAPLSLTDDEVYAVSAYVLWRNDGIVGEDDVLNADTLRRVKMPNRDGFVPYWPPPK